MTKLATVFAAVAILAGWYRPAMADETRLIMTTISLPNTPASATYHNWADSINAKGKGIVTIDVRDGMSLVNSSNYYDRLLGDVVQISFGSLNYLAGKFKLSQVMALPFMFDTSEQASAVFWRLYKTGLLDSEFDEITPLFFQGFPQQSLHLVKAPTTPLVDLKGLKIIVSGQTATSVTTHLGGSPLSIPLSDTYEALQRGTADGFNFPMAPLFDFKINEVTHYHIMASLGGGPGGVWMAKTKYQSLSPEIRKILEDNSGEAESRQAGRDLDSQQAAAPERLKADPSQIVTTLTPDQTKAWEADVAGAISAWADGSGPQANAVLTKARELAAEIKASK